MPCMKDEKKLKRIVERAYTEFAKKCQSWPNKK